MNSLRERKYTLVWTYRHDPSRQRSIHVSGYLKNSQLRRQLEEKVREAAQSRQVAEAAIAEARGLVESARKVDADVRAAEAILAEADAAMGGKDYRLASEKAKEALERGRAIHRDRSETIVASSESLVILARGLGESLEEGEAALKKAREALAAEEFTVAVEHAKRAWKRSEKTLHEHLSASFSKAQSLILSARNFQRDVAAVEDLLSRARGSLEANDYASALSFTKEALDTISEDLRSIIGKEMAEAEELTTIARDIGVDVSKPLSLLERARGDIAHYDFEKARNAVRQCRGEVEKAFLRGLDRKSGTLSRTIEAARAIGADSTAAQDRFGLAEAAVRDGDYSAGVRLAREALQALNEAQFQSVVRTMASSREKFVRARDVGADIGGAMTHLNAAREALNRRAFEEALEGVRKADEEIDRAVGKYRDAEDRLRELHRVLAEMEGLGVQTARARGLADQARSAFHSRDASEIDRAVTQAFDELGRAQHDRALEVLERGEALLTLAAKQGIAVSDAPQLIEGAIQAARESHDLRALELARKAAAQAEDALRRIVNERILALKDLVPHLGDDSANVKVLLNRAEGSMSTGDLEGAFTALASAGSSADSRARTVASASIDNLAVVVELGVDLGADVAGVDALRKEMDGFMSAGRSMDVLAARDRIRSLLSSSADVLLGHVKNRVAQARELKIDIEEMWDLLKRSKMALSLEDYHEGLALLKECNKKAGAATALHRKVQNALAGAAALAADAKKRDVDVTKVLDILLEGKRAFDRYDYNKALDFAARARAETDKLMILYTSAQKIMACRERLELAERLGLDTKALAGSFLEAKEAMKSKDYDRALAQAQRVEAEVTSLLRTEVARIVDAAESPFKSIEGVSRTPVEGETNAARRALESDQFAAAVDAALRLRGQGGKLRRQADESDAAIRRVRDIVADIEGMDLAVPATKELLAKAEGSFRAGRFEEALDHAAQAEAEAPRERERGLAAILDRLHSEIDKNRRERLDTAAAEKQFAQAKEQLKAKKYRQAIAAVAQGEAVLGRSPQAQRVALDAGRASIGIKEYGAASEGAPKGTISPDAPSAERLDARKARESAQALFETASSIGAETSEFAERLREAEAAYEAGDLPRARSAYAESRDWGAGLVRAHLKDLVAKVEGAAATCRRLSIDPAPALQRIAKARPRLDEDDFVSAFAHLIEGRQLAESGLTMKLGEALRQAEASVSEANASGADTHDAEETLAKTRESLGRKEYESALELIDRALEQVESAKAVDKRLGSLTSKAESMIRNGKRFGIDLGVAEDHLARSVELRESNLAAAAREAEEAYRIAWEAVEAFAPNVKASLGVEQVRAGEWVDTTVTLENSGRGLAKDVSVKLLGDVDAEGPEPIPAVRAKGAETLPLRLRIRGSGSVTLSIQVTYHRVFDDKAYTQETTSLVHADAETSDSFRRLVSDMETRCAICKGMIKKGFKVVRCACGRDLHELCAGRVGRCPACFRPLASPVPHA